MWLRVNQQQNNTKTYRTLLEKQEIAAFECDNPHALRLAQPLSVSKLPNFGTRRSDSSGSQCPMVCFIA